MSSDIYVARRSLVACGGGAPFKAIDKNVSAVLTKHRWDHDIKYDVKQGVVTLKGKVNSQSQRAMVEKVVAATPNVAQVVNEIEVKNQKATSSSS